MFMKHLSDRRNDLDGGIESTHPPSQYDTETWCKRYCCWQGPNCPPAPLFAYAGKRLLEKGRGAREQKQRGVGFGVAMMTSMKYTSTSLSVWLSRALSWYAL